MGGGTTPGTFSKSWFDLDANGVADIPDSSDVWWKAGRRDRAPPRAPAHGPELHHHGQRAASLPRGQRRDARALPAPVRLGGPGAEPVQLQVAVGHVRPERLPLELADAVRPDAAQPDRQRVLGRHPRRSSRYTSAHQQLFRFNLGSTLLGDGYIALNSGSYNCTYWQPEYDLHLGWPMGPAFPTVIGGVTIWRRNFTSGEAWVNPTGVAVAAGATNPAIAGWDAVIRQTSGTIGVEPSPSAEASVSRPRGRTRCPTAARPSRSCSPRASRRA
jgi:hypothetical protein